VLHIQVLAGDEPRMAGADGFCMAGDGDILYGRR
jgi:hypothetical protein